MKKTKSKLYFGMSITQISILAGAGLMALVVVAVVMIVVLTSGTSYAQTQSNQPTAAGLLASETPAATNTPIVEETPTETPAPISATKVPAGGWVEFKTKNATLWLPASFIGGDMISDKEATINKVIRMGKYYKGIVASLKAADKELVLFALDKTPMLTDIVTTVQISHDVDPQSDNLDEYIKLSLASSNSEGTPAAAQLAMNEKKKMTILGREARRLTASAMSVGHEAVGIIYYIKDEGTIWSVTYIMSTNQYVDMLAVAEESIQTFNIIP